MFKRNKKSSSSTLSNRRARTGIDSPFSATSNRFVRSKTLSSYVSGSNTSSERESEKSERQRIHYVKARQKHVTAILSVLIVLILIMGTIIFNFTSKVTVSAVSSGADIVNAPQSDTYEALIKEYLGSHPSSRLRFTLNLEDLSSYLKAEAPEVKYVKRASFNGIGTSNYDIVFRQPIIKWQAGSQTYYVDAEGVSFQNNMFAEPEIELRDSSMAGGLVTDGEVKISRRILEFSGRLASGIQQQNYQIEYLILPEDTTRQIAVKIIDKPTEFIFSIDHTVTSQVEAMRQVMGYLDETGERPARVDLRVPNRAYY